MNKKKWILSLSFLGIFSVLLISSDLFGPQKTAEAACGASTSSCKTCHEVQGEDPVSKNGDWHVQHSFGDFCQACHLGVSTANDKTAAHEGMVVKPLSQPDQSCATCHPADLDARVTKYGGSATSTATPGATSTEASSGDATPSAAATQVPPGGDSNFDQIDFNKFLEGKTPLLAWIIGITDLLILLVLVVLILKWKKGFWIWSLLRKKNTANLISLNDLPYEAQEVLKQLAKSDMPTILALAKILKRKDGMQLLGILSRLSEEDIDRLRKMPK